MWGGGGGGLSHAKLSSKCVQLLFSPFDIRTALLEKRIAHQPPMVHAICNMRPMLAGAACGPLGCPKHQSDGPVQLAVQRRANIIVQVPFLMKRCCNGASSGFGTFMQQFKDQCTTHRTRGKL